MRNAMYRNGTDPLHYTYRNSSILLTAKMFVATGPYRNSAVSERRYKSALIRSNEKMYYFFFYLHEFYNQFSLKIKSKFFSRGTMSCLINVYRVFDSS